MNAPDTGVGGTQTGRMSDAPTVGREAFVKEFRERMQGKLPDDKIDAAAEAMTAATTSYVAIMVPITVLVYTRVQVLIHDSKAPTRPQFRGNAGGLIIPPLPLISAATSAPFLPTISRGFALRSAGRSSSMLRRSTRASLSGTTTTCSSATAKVAASYRHPSVGAAGQAPGHTAQLEPTWLLGGSGLRREQQVAAAFAC